MPEGPPSFNGTARLSRSTLKVLGHVREHPCKCSSRHMAEALTLSRRTVQGALDLLDELGCIKTQPGKPNRAASYLIQPAGLEILKGGAELRQVLVENEVLVGGASCASTWRNSEENEGFPTGAY